MRRFLLLVFLLLDFPRRPALDSGERRVRADGRAWCLLALGAEPLSIGHGVQGRIEAFDVIWVVALDCIQRR